MARRGGTALGAALLALALTGASGCSGGSGGSGEPSAAASSRAGTPITPAYPSGAASTSALTEPGSELQLGQAASVAWQPKQDLVGTLRLSVSKVERTTFERSFQDWKVDARTATYTPYFVHASVTNLGETDLGGVPVPLYGQSATDALVEPATFKTTFKPCHPGALPSPFPSGATASVCLVYLVPDHGQLVGAAFRPSEQFQTISWTGPIAAPPPAKKRGKASRRR